MTKTLGDIEDIYQRTWRAVYARCRLLTGNDADAHDLSQEAFMSLVENRDAFRGESSIITYLFSIATKLSITRLRARLRRSEEWSAAVASMLEATRPSGDPSLRLEAKQVILEALIQHDETTSLMVVHHYADGMSQGEIAEMLGVSRVTVNQRLSRFRRTLEEAAS